MEKKTEQKRLLRVGVDDAPPVPMQMGDPASETFRGYEVDLLRVLAERLNCKIEYSTLAMLRERWFGTPQTLNDASVQKAADSRLLGFHFVGNRWP